MPATSGRLLGRLRAGIAYVRAPAGRAAVLRYHRVAEPPLDPWGLAVSPARFAEQLEVLRERFRPLSLRALAEAISRGAIPRRSVAVTFDDGYRDNLTEAKPLLERYGVPATVFVTSGYVASGRDFWWDELEEVCLRAPELPKRVELEVGGERLTWDAGGPVVVVPSSWRAWEEPPTPRHALFRALYDRLEVVAHAPRLAALDVLREVTGVERSGEATTMSAEEIVRLAEGGLVEVGAHTVTHPALERLSRAQQAEEIGKGRSELEALLGRPVTSFSYPHGRYGPETVECVREAGFERACTNVKAPAALGSPLHEIPRLPAGDRPGEELFAQLASWLRG